MDQTGHALDAIMQRVGEIDRVMADIAHSAQEQATGLAQVNVAVNQMDRVVQQNAAMVEESTAATQTLKGEAADLLTLVARFRLEAAAAGAQAAGASAASPALALRQRVAAAAMGGGF